MINKGLRSILTARHISMEELSTLSGVPLETIRNLFYHKAENPRLNTVLALSRALNVSVESLVQNTVQNAADEDENLLLENYRRCSPHGKYLIDLIASMENEMSTNTLNTSNRYTIPCFTADNAAIDGSFYSTYNATYIDVNTPKAYAAIRIPNNMFAPEYCLNDVVLLSSHFPNSGEHALFLHQGQLYFRKFQIVSATEYLLSAIHGRGPDIHVQNLHQYRLIGTCIGIFRCNLDCF